MVVSFHKYWNYNNRADIDNYLKIREEQNVPIWMGEGGENSNTWFTDAITLLEEHSIGWNWWPLKKMGANNPLQIKQPAGYRELAKYLREGKGEITKEQATATLMELAATSHNRNNIFHADIVDAMFRQVQSTATLPYRVNIVSNNFVLYAADYDRGRSGYSYFDSDSGNYWVSTNKHTPWNRGNAYRNDGVDISACDDTLTNGYSVGWTEDGEWLQYTLDVREEGWYYVKVRTKSVNGHPGSVALLVNNRKSGDDVLLNYDTPGKWNTTSIKNVWLAKGVNKLKLMIVKGGIDLNYMEFQSTSSAMQTSNKNK
jgi:hypothetical protein